MSTTSATSRAAATPWQRIAEKALFAMYPDLPRPPGSGLAAQLAQMRQPTDDDTPHDVDHLLALRRDHASLQGAKTSPKAGPVRAQMRDDDGSDLRAWASDEGFELALDDDPAPAYGKPAAEMVDCDMIVAALAEGDDPWAMDGTRQTYRPPVALSPAKVMMAARLAQSIHCAGGTDLIFAPGAATILLCGSAAEAKTITKVIMEGLRFATVQGMSVTGLASVPIEIVGPDSAVSSQPDRLLQDVATRLDHPAPLIVILTEAHQRHGALAHLPVVKVAPVSRDALLWVLRWTHSATGKIAEEEVRAALPSGEALSALAPDLLALALRADGPLRAARALARIAATSVPVGATGPTLRDLPALGAAGQQLERQAADLVAYRDGRLDWSDIPSGILLHGAPGTGKTFVAQAFATTIDAPFFPTSLGTLQQAGHLGDMLAALAKIMDQARAAARKHGIAVIFIDEIDSLGKRHDSAGHNANYDNKVIGELLNKLDGVESLEGVMVIGAANHPSHIDPAILRSGRLGLHIEMRSPSGRDLVNVFRHHLKGDLWDVDLSCLAQSAVGATMADVKGIVQIARQTARAENRPVLLSDLSGAVANQREVESEDLRYRIAVHEAGHAVAAHVTGAMRPRRITMQGLGSHIEMRHRPNARTMDDLHREVIVHLAGRAAEEVLLGQPSGGGGGDNLCDLAQATRLLIGGTLNYGHGDSLLWCSSAEEPATLFARHTGLQNSVDRGLRRAYAEALVLLRKNIESLSAIANHARIDGVVEENTLRDLLLYCHTPGDVPRV
jgi:hypothetical protein